VSLGSVLTKCSPWASPPPLGANSKEPSSAREWPPPRGLFLLPTAALDGPHGATAMRRIAISDVSGEVTPAVETTGKVYSSRQQ
jgi:hypothetical protein